MIPRVGLNNHQYDPKAWILTLDVLNTEFLNKTGREYTRSESATKDFRKLVIQTSYTHILKFEVGCQDGIGGCPTTMILVIS